MEDQEQKVINKCKFKICFLINGTENFEKILRKFTDLLDKEKSLLQSLIPKTEYEEFISKYFGSEKPEPEIIKRANKIIEEFSKGEGNDGRKK